MSRKILRYPDLQARGYGNRITIWRNVRAGKFPAPVDVLGRVGWFEDVIDAWEASRPHVSYAPDSDTGAAA